MPAGKKPYKGVKQVMKSKGLKDTKKNRDYAKDRLKRDEAASARSRAGDAARKLAKKKGGTASKHYARKGK